ncbi:3255_t:CDS:2 [Paraglomus brasilianum]|uniref:3255_t:CDS:1 n=1 Tax=Paraglomus brasilianum TaxID=144538 RepID=A0A9N8W9C6_9GLOM|nr:3255_t:CDS:2 [Paraglomus brasilianum]
MTNKQSYFDLKNPIEWNIVEFHRFFIEKNKDRPERLEYKRAADKLNKSLRSIVNTSSNVDTIRKALKLQETAKRGRRKGGVLDKIWTSVEAELEEKKLTDLQLYGLLQAMRANQNYASKLNHGALESLEGVITSIKHKSESEQSEPNKLKRKMIESNVLQQISDNERRQVRCLQMFNEDIRAKRFVCHAAAVSPHRMTHHRKIQSNSARSLKSGFSMPTLSWVNLNLIGVGSSSKRSHSLYGRLTISYAWMTNNVLGHQNTSANPFKINTKLSLLGVLQFDEFF